MNCIVIFKSKYGSTERYAKLLAEALGCQAVRAADAKKLDPGGYDTVIFGGGLYAGGISGVSFITGRWDALKNKRVIVFTVGIADPAHADYKPVIDKTFSDEQKRSVRVFHLRGGIDYEKLSLPHRAIMTVLANILKRKKESELPPEAEAVLTSYGKRVDYVNAEALQPIKDYVLRQENG